MCCELSYDVFREQCVLCVVAYSVLGEQCVLRVVCVAHHGEQAGDLGGAAGEHGGHDEVEQRHELQQVVL